MNDTILYWKKGSGIHIKPENKGKFTATMKRTGKTAEQLAHSKNPLTRKRAIFALNARKWKHQEGGLFTPFTPIFDNREEPRTNYVEITPNKPNNIPRLPSEEELLLRQYFMESGFKNDSTSRAGAKGAFQIMPHIYKAYVKATGNDGDLTDYQYNKSIRDWLLNEDIAKNKKLMHDNQLPIVKLAKKYAAYNYGTGNLNKVLAELQKKGIDINNSLDWIDYLNKETRDYVNFVVLGKDINEYKNNKNYKAALQKHKTGGTILKWRN